MRKARTAGIGARSVPMPTRVMPMSAPEPGDTAKSANTPGESQDEGFRLRVSNDKMAVLLDCNTGGKDICALAEMIVAKLLSYGVQRPPAADWVASWLLELTRESPLLEGAVVMEGMPPIPPVDGRIEWTGDYFNQGFVWDELTDRVDFRSHAGQRNVKEGQLLATLIKPRVGESGHDVFGKPVRPRKPRNRRIRVGTNVLHDEESDSYYSKIDGRIRFCNDILSVDDHFEIPGDVGLKTGHISHTGSVLVQHDVLEGSRLEAVGDIEVLGIVEAAHIQTGGTLIVHGGITGEGGAKIVAAAGVTARYIIDADVQAGDDVVVEREIVQSQVQTRGAVRVPSGRIVGGRIVALEGVEAGQIGSPAMVATDIIAGEDYCIEGRNEILRTKIEAARKGIEKIHATIDPLRGKVASLTDEKKRAVKTLLEQLAIMEAGVLELAEEEEELRAESEERRNQTILIRGKLFPEARLRIDDKFYVTSEPFSGPVKAFLTEHGIRIAPTKMSSLRKKKEDP